MVMLEALESPQYVTPYEREGRGGRGGDGRMMRESEMEVMASVAHSP